MVGYRIFSLVLACCLLVSFSGEASAQWLFEKKPEVKDSALAIARQIPRQAKLVLGFDLQGQLDVLGLVSDAKAAYKKSSFDQDALVSFEKEMGLSPQEWLDLFTGAGYFSILDPKSSRDLSEGKGLVFGLRLKKSAAFLNWLEPKFGKEAFKRSSGDFQIWEISDGTQFAVGRGWFLVGSDRSASAHQLATLLGTEASLYNDSSFEKATSSLTGGDSALFLYLDGPGVRRAALDFAGVSQDHPAAEEFEFWDSAILSFDFQSEQSDGFLAYSAGEGRTLAALRAPGAVSVELVNLVPAGQSTFSIADARWITNVLTAFGQDVPDVGFLLTMAQTQLNRYGSLSEAFAGTVVLATNTMDFLARSLQEDFRRARSSGPFEACQSNLRNIGTACEMWSTDYAGKFPERLDQLAPDYLREIPRCPASHLEYGYKVDREMGYDNYQIICTGHAHPETEADHPQYSAVVGLVEGEPQVIVSESHEQGPASEGLSEPSVYVAMPVKSVEVAHDLMTTLVDAYAVTDVDACAANLTNILTAAEMYSIDHSGAYPKSLDQLTPDYLHQIPLCPTAGVDTYSRSYRVVPPSEGQEWASVVAFCQGHNHPELQVDKPAIDPDKGKAVTGPREESATSRLSRPVTGRPQRYNVADGTKAILDSDRNLLTMTYGPKSDDLLVAPSGQVPNDASVARALQWGDGRIVYLDYFNLNPFYAAGIEMLEQAVKDGEANAQVALDLVRKTRRRVGKLEGVSAVRTTDSGLHYRSTGVGSSQVLTVFGLGGAILVPNFVRAKSQGQLTACESNLKNIGTACEMWATDYDGEYPTSLEQLTPNYLQSIPVCPAAGKDTYSVSYRVVMPEESGVSFPFYEVYCKGHFHEKDGLFEDSPRYNGVEGLVEP